MPSRQPLIYLLKGNRIREVREVHPIAASRAPGPQEAPGIQKEQSEVPHYWLPQSQ